MPPYFAQYLSANYQNIEEIPNLEKNNSNIFNNLINNQFSSEIRRTHTEKQNKNFNNILFGFGNNIQNNQESINYGMRRNSTSFIPIYNYNAYKYY